LRSEDIAEAGFRTGDHVQTARLHAQTKAKSGQSLEFAFDLAKVSYFEPEPGRRAN